MCDYNGDDLLKVFKELNVSLLNINPVVIKAWFDTDDRNLKKLLTWMCTSLSKENYLSPLENAEFLELGTTLIGDQYEREVKNIESLYPDIFNVDMNMLEIELLEDEIELALEEEMHLDNLVKINKTLQNSLSKELAETTSQEIQTALTLKSSQDLCNALGKNLDKINEKLHTQLTKYGSNLYDFQFGSVPHFINNMDIKECQENFDNLSSFLTPLLDRELFSVNQSRSAENQTLTESINANDSVTHTLNTIKDRILHSHQNYVITKIEVEKVREVLKYLNKTDIDSVLRLTESAYTQMSRKGKEETKRRMCGMLDGISVKLAEHHVAQTKLKYAQQELQSHQTKLDELKKIEKTVLKFLSHYFLLSILYGQEKKDIDNSDQFFRKVLHYIGGDLKSCAVRTEKMNKIIHEYEDYNLKNIGGRFKMIKSIVAILTGEQDLDLLSSLEVVGEFKTELDRLENKMFCSDFYDHRAMVKELRANVDVLRSFLTCGPTRRIVLVPPELQQVLSVVEDHLKRQIASVKSAVEISCSVKKIPDKWQNYRRQLWMYFYTDQRKLFHVLQEVEEEFKKRKLNGV